MKTVNIKGKDYVEVSERIKYFREKYQDWVIKTELIENAPGHCVFKATIIDHEGDMAATGHAREVEGDGMVNKTSYLENCETSAIGRALGCLGIGIDASVASADEVANAIAQQEAPAPKKKTAKPPPPADAFISHDQNKVCFKQALTKKIKSCNLNVALTDKPTATALLLEICDIPEVLQLCLDNEFDCPTNLMGDDDAAWQVMARVVTDMKPAAFRGLVAKTLKEVVESE